jgi:very-short-patch-repair endonuclease
VRRLGIRQPVPEVVAGEVGQYRLDLACQEILFAIEVDGFAWHHSPEQKRRDELRRQRLREAGWTLLVFDWWQLTKQADWVASEICTTYQRLMAEASQ